MEDLEHYLEDFVEPTIKDFEERPTSVRRAFLACVAVFHSLDYLAYNRATRSPSKAKVGKLKRDFGNASADFKLVDEAAHAFKHVVARGLPEQRLRSHEVVNRGGAFSSGFSSGFDVGAVTIVNRPEVNLLATVKQVVRFLREYKPVTRS